MSRYTATALIAALAAASLFSPSARAGNSYWMDTDGLFWNNANGWDQLKIPKP